MGRRARRASTAPLTTNEAHQQFDELVKARGLAVASGEVVELSDAREILAEADYYFHDVLWWGRAFEDRVFGQGKRNDQAEGLIHLLPAPVRSRAQLSAQVLLPRLRECRWLTNYSLHCESVNRTVPSVRKAAGGWQVPIPDEQKGSVPAYTNFNYTERRDGLTYCRGLAMQVVQFIDKLLDEFENVERDRLGSAIRSEQGSADDRN